MWPPTVPSTCQAEMGLVHGVDSPVEELERGKKAGAGPFQAPPAPVPGPQPPALSDVTSDATNQCSAGGLNPLPPTQCLSAPPTRLHPTQPLTQPDLNLLPPTTTTTTASTPGSFKVGCLGLEEPSDPPSPRPRGLPTCTAISAFVIMQGEIPPCTQTLHPQAGGVRDAPFPGGSRRLRQPRSCC